ncbi:unnamed protein product [Anisakis simplex]|uniref:Protein male abnormal 3 (inferred by orthology to a C. elegans protein) n=1 Tax=Anisakis simplex TaxID=6269 RepID=A0A0M3K5L4_ANISI|nr:unnamed protein product [Anisakis simplex]
MSDRIHRLKYATCECADCRMVEERRRLNNMLSRRRFETDSGDEKTVGKKVRDPKCALCSAHGEKQPLRGHKKAQCPFLKCGCHLCGLVENRRTLMARQIKLRRDQQKQRKAQLLVNTTSANFQSQISPINMNEAAKEDVGMTTLVSPEKEKLSEPLRVPPLMPVPVKPDCTAPFTPLLLQHSPVLAASSSMLLPPPVPAPPVTIASTITAPSAIEQLDLRLIPPISAPYPVMSPYNFHFPPIFPYTTALQFLTS